MLRTLLSIALLSFGTQSLLAVPTPEQLLRNQTHSYINESKLPESAESKEFATLLSKTPEWQRELCDSGPVEDAAKTVQVLFDIWKTDKELVKRPIDRAMATACALEGGHFDWNSETMLERYEYFRDKWNLGLLNIMYKDLTVFERRYLAHGVQHRHLNGLESMEYQNTEVCLPAERYTGACWYARWILLNPFGDTIHGPLYYQPYRNSWTNAAEMIRNIGGVCGSLSNFGAAAAIANGVPAITMGEPGHCAYTVMIKHNQWQPAYSLSWKRGIHRPFYGQSSWGWHVLTNKAMADTKDVYASADIRRLAMDYGKKKLTGKALETIAIARRKYPLDWQNWQTSAELMNELNGPTSQWQELHQDTLQLLASTSPEAAWTLLDKYVYKHVLPEGKDKADDRERILLAYQKSISGWGVARWEYDRALSKQIKLLAGDKNLEDQFAVSCFGAHVKENTLTPVILEHQLSRIGKDDDRRSQFIASIGKGLSKGKGDDFNNVIETLAKKILPDAAKNGDKSTFQFIGSLTKKVFKPTEISPEKFPGTLLSSGGTFTIDEPGNRWDNPARHWGVIEEHGGDFHTGNKNPHATIQLGNYGLLSGVTVVTRGGQIGRLNGAVLETSLDGKEWSTVYTFSSVKRVNRIPLADKKIEAGYVRISHPKKQHLHFEKFHVYGKKIN
ncbi:hypothetical protein Rhal01_01192 [Rubritalea halochordaticola]|uniref:F5/8 type C domain-containing protein n=1 Tax=Rubritalea halochordaticola TaxID=714537 RepID=A0ABP9V316_9BACT